MRDNMLKLNREEKIKYFGEGEWLDEPDFVEFNHNGIKCIIKRICIQECFNKSHVYGGFLCGYIKIPEDHILYRELNDYLNDKFEVHGGITFNDMLEEEHWVGIDCAHSGDFHPSIEMFKKNNDSDFYKKNEEFFELLKLTEIFKPTYKNIAFVKQELMSLADQVLEYGK